MKYRFIIQECIEFTTHGELKTNTVSNVDFMGDDKLIAQINFAVTQEILKWKLKDNPNERTN